MSVAFHGSSRSFLGFEDEIFVKMSQKHLWFVIWVGMLASPPGCFCRITSYLILQLCFSTAQSTFWLSEVVNPSSGKLFERHVMSGVPFFFSSVIFFRALSNRYNTCIHLCINKKLARYWQYWFLMAGDAGELCVFQVLLKNYLRITCITYIPYT